jgi:hypothetical protein
MLASLSLILSQILFTNLLQKSETEKGAFLHKREPLTRFY